MPHSLETPQRSCRYYKLTVEHFQVERLEILRQPHAPAPKPGLNNVHSTLKPKGACWNQRPGVAGKPEGGDNGLFLLPAFPL